MTQKSESTRVFFKKILSILLFLFCFLRILIGTSNSQIWIVQLCVLISQEDPLVGIKVDIKRSRLKQLGMAVHPLTARVSVSEFHLQYIL